MARFRAAVVGCGGISREHVEGYLNHPNIDLVALADIDQDRLTRAGQAYGVDRLYKEHRELFEREKPDIVSVCTSAKAHCEITVFAAACGSHVLCEKPIAVDLAEADAMISACEKAKVRLAVNHQLRLTPEYTKLKQIMDDGHIGDLKAIYDLGKGRIGSFEMMEMGTHMFDTMRFFAGDAESVFAHVTTEGRDTVPSDAFESSEKYRRDIGRIAGDDIFSFFTFAGGVNGIAEFYKRTEVEATVNGPTLKGSRGMLSMKVKLPRGFSIHHYPKDVWTPAQDEDWKPIVLAKDEYVLLGKTWPSYHIIRSIDEMVRCIEEDRPHRCSGEGGRAALEMIVGVYASHFEATHVRFPLGLRKHPLVQYAS